MFVLFLEQIKYTDHTFEPGDIVPVEVCGYHAGVAMFAIGPNGMKGTVHYDEGMGSRAERYVLCSSKRCLEQYYDEYRNRPPEPAVEDSYTEPNLEQYPDMMSGLGASCLSSRDRNWE